MAGMIAYIDRDKARLDRECLLDAINPEGVFSATAWENSVAFIASGSLPAASVARETSYVSDRFVASLCGDLIADNWPGWPAIHDSLTRSDYEIFRDFGGAFVLSVFDVESETLWVVNDRFSLHPVYYSFDGQRVLFATRLAPFLRLAARDPGLDPAWLYELIFFNYAIGPTTLLRGVRRFGPATVARFDLGRRELSWSSYAPLVRRAASLLTGDEAVGRATEVFRDTVGRYLPPTTDAAFSLSAGLDSRTILAAMSGRDRRRLKVFTYGIEDTDELHEAAQVAELLQLEHQQILLDQTYLDQLPLLMHDTVFLSDTLQGINRSGLLYVYRVLTDRGRRHPLILTGVSGDHLFRDHIRGSGNVPYIISADMMSLFHHGRGAFEHGFYRRIFGQRTAEFAAHIDESLDTISRTYGDFDAPEAYLSYLVYEVTPRYFGGQAAVANTCSTFRTPYWDPAIVGLAHEIELGTLGASHKYAEQQRYLENVLQASVIANSADVGTIPFRHLPITAFTGASHIRYGLHRLARKFRALSTWRARRQFEDWPLWYRTVLGAEIRNLLGQRSMIREYVSDTFIQQMIHDNNIHWLGKLLTAEIALRLLDNGWRRLTDADDTDVWFGQQLSPGERAGARISGASGL